jgi:hypothetical protein
LIFKMLLLEMRIGSPLSVREPTSFQTKGGNKMASNNTNRPRYLAGLRLEW